MWSDLKKSAKTTIAAAVAAYVAFTKPNARIRFVGNDLKQADSRVFNALTTAIDLNPQWKSEITVRQHTLIFPNGSIIESVPVDPAGEAGGNDDMIEWTELWAATHKAHVKLWNELTLSPTKFGESFRWVDTYAGYSGESEVLESLYKLAVIDGQPLDLGLAGLEVFSNRRFFCLWNTKPLLSWLTPEYYAQEAAMLTDNEFRRLHKNEWVSSSETFVPLEWWTACKVASMPPVERNPVVIALDAGISDDAFAMVAVSRENKQVRVRYAKAWRPPKDGQVDFRNVETELKRLVGIYNVAEVCYDPYQLHDFCKRLQRDGVAFFKEFSQGTDRLIADKSLYDMIRDRTIEHDGNAELTEHIQNANAKTEGDKAMRIVKRSASGKIDCAVALSMANYRICKLVW
ncbi:MAG: hypothetical protein A2W25_02400 [candidate division Zixibacteria bacterium RBG_16_53_22]|nr:MAG: hypothetical protein A2W25_02400 [candidate division Zixibacteria bacterium RBG_16_53_22]